MLANGSSNGIDLDFYNKSNVLANDVQRIKESLGIKENNFVFLFVGRLVKDKGIVELIDAFIELLKTQPSTKLVLVGKLEPERDELPKEVLNTILNHSNIHY
ncbi:MAG: glycosyltransferase, partial [Flavobacterium sp.]